MPSFRLVTITALIILTLNLANDAPGAHADGGGEYPVPEKYEPAYPNLGSRLDRLAVRVEDEGTTAEEAARETAMHQGGSVAVTIRLSGNVDEVAAFLEENGGSPRNVGEKTIEAYVPVELLGRLSQQPGVLRVREIIPPQPAQGTPAVNGNGPVAHLSEAWNQAGVSGQGVKVGIIEPPFAFNGFQGLMGTELPETVQARCYIEVGIFTTELDDCTHAEYGSEHGTTVAEAVMDIAPEVSLYIATPGSGGDLLAVVDWMAAEGVSVINFSVSTGFDGPGDGTSPDEFSPLKAVDLAVEKGIVWVSAAGNHAEKTWFGPHSTLPLGEFDFLVFDGTDTFNGIILDAGDFVRVELRWDDTWEKANRDLDLVLWDGADASLVAVSDESQAGIQGQDPLEVLRFRASSGGRYYISVVHYGGEQPDWVQLMIRSPIPPIQYHTGSGSIVNPAESANPGLLAVGAAPWYDTDTIESFSSRGPTPDGRVKPDIVGADCGETALRPLNEYRRGFCGTSQASPHVAGLAALVRQRFPDLGPMEVAEYLKGHAIQREAPDPNNTWGHGFAVLPPIVLCSNNPGLEADCAALLAGRDTLAGTGTLNWSANVPVEDWDGVTVGGSPLRVTELRLRDKGLTGEIPGELGSLANLEVLSLWENELTGTIPAELGQLANLTILALGGNQLSGTIPAWLGSLASLEGLYLWGNELTGEIPAELGSLANLEELWLSENQLTGTIPVELGGLVNLEELWLSENQLTGTIPMELGSLANLKGLSLTRNQLTGEIPPELARLTGLTVLALGGNQLSGTIPTWLGTLVNLEELYLWGNELTGTIPAELGQLANLAILELSSNQLTGTIPAELGSLASLERLYLWENELTGEIPTELGNLTSLEWLSISRNQLTGEIPAELGGLTSLEILNLGGNQLSGTIPAWLGSLVNLEELYLWGNELTGEIPAELGSLVNLTILELGTNQLSGTIPTELGSLVNLEELRLHNNQLTGEIPVELGSLTNLTVLHLSGNQLTGCVPSGWRDVDDNDFSELGLSFCDPGDPLIARYDANNNGMIDRSEVIRAINDYLFGEGEETISRSDVIRLINLYLFG